MASSIVSLSDKRQNTGHAIGANVGLKKKRLGEKRAERGGEGVLAVHQADRPP